MQNNTVIIITGPTASGKSAIGAKLAKQINGVIINSDSMQVYKELPILSASPTIDSTNKVPHLLYNCINGSTRCSAGMWLDLVNTNIKEQLNSDKIPIILGGSPMYNRVLVDGLSQISKTPENILQEAKLYDQKELHQRLQQIDPISAQKIHPKDSMRALRAYTASVANEIPFSQLIQQKKTSILNGLKVFKFCILPPRQTVYNNCDSRFHKFIPNAVDEVKNFMQLNLQKDLPIYGTLGVKELIQYILSNTTLAEAILLSQTATRQYAKHQYTWFNNRFTDFIKIDNSTKTIEKILATIQQ